MPLYGCAHVSAMRLAGTARGDVCAILPARMPIDFEPEQANR